jgi:PAS domain S-box-containing protein
MKRSDEKRRLVADVRNLRRVEHDVARILAETERPVEAYEATLEAIGRPLGWRLGAVWELDSLDGRLHCVRVWHAERRDEEFEALSEKLALEPGEGLPGRVVMSGSPVWMVDAPEDVNFPRAEAARRSGLHAGFAFPVLGPRGLVGVMEFFAGELREPDERLLATMGVLGTQLGQFVARRRAEDEVRASESRLRAILNAALDAVVTMNADGRVTGWNPAAEAIFGHSADEAIGREMAELIVPPRLRNAHRRGLARFLETGQGVVLDRRLELTGLRRDGIEFPVELTITRIPLPGAPTFTGYLRDITDRVQADRELRTSRARLVEVADAERKRIQRNLHDGAQQRLTSVLLYLGRIRASAGEHDPLLDIAIDELAAGLDEIRELARGLHPSLLSERGLVAALEALVMRTPLPVALEAVPDRRLPEPVEAAAFYVVAEALANVHKHAQAGQVVVRATIDGEHLDVSVLDDGVGGADPHGHGLQGLADRVEALGGRLTVDSRSGGGTRLRAEIPHGGVAALEVPSLGTPATG